LVLAGGCVPGREAQSAGQVGCTPEEISISDDQTHFGLIQSSETWVAECRGHTFVCSQANQSGDNHGFLASLFASEQVSCREAAEQPETALNNRIEEPSSAERGNQLTSAPPTGAAGFDFGETPEDAARRCQAAGETWRGGGGDNPTDNPGCSGPAASLGIKASVDLAFCGGRACVIALDDVPSGSWSQSAVALKDKLETKYGSARKSSGIIPEHCRSEQGFARCLETEEVTLQYEWTWPGGKSIDMTVGKTKSTGHAMIRLVYRDPAGAAQTAL
jgi:hypothetical protein